MTEIVEPAKDALEHGGEPRDTLNNLVAILVALTATFMALCNVKDGNVVQAMAQHQAKAVDTWAFYQAKGTKQHLAEAMVEQLKVTRELTPPSTPDRAAKLDAAIARYEAEARRYEAEKAQIKAEAEGHERAYDALNFHDDQFDMAEALMSMALALFGITALTRKRGLLAVSAGFAALGVAFGIAGFLGWNLHPEWLARLLG